MSLREEWTRVLREVYLKEKTVPYDNRIHHKSGNAIYKKGTNIKIGSFSKDETGKSMVKLSGDQPNKDTEPEPKPKKEKPSETPQSKKGKNPERVVGGKNKTLKEVDTTNSEFYNEDIDPSDTEYKLDKKYQIGPPPEPFKFSDEIPKGRFPKKYITLIERMINSKRNSKNPPISDFISGAGAGQNSSQAGEILSMMAVTMTDKEWNAVSNSILDHEKKQIESDPKLKSSGSRIVSKGWIEAATNNRQAIFNQIRGNYPEGTVITHAGWDTEKDTEALGWSNYKDQKGFSTDIFIKVRLKTGEERMHEVSLKKDTSVNFLNSGTGKFTSWDESLKGSDIDPATHAKGERDRLASFAENNKSELETLAKNNKELQALMKSKKIKSITDIIPPANRAQSKILFNAMNIMAGSPKFGYNDTTGKVTTDDPQTDAQKAVYEHIEKVREYCIKATKSVVEKDKLKQAMIDEIKSEFPLKSVGEGEETMAIGNLSLDKKVMEDIFGTSDFEKIKENLVVDETTNPPHLAYLAEGGKKTIRLARIDIRQDGIGYGGSSMRFDMRLADDFAKTLEDSNNKLYSSKTEEKKYESLEGIISRMHQKR